MTRSDFRALMIFLIPCFAACADSERDGDETATGLSIAADNDEHAGTATKSLPRLKSALLAPGERRVTVLVVPGDASVEIDGRPVFRRNGLVEIVGRVGDGHKIRVFKGTRSTEEKNVAIVESGVTPALVDLNEALPVEAAPVTKKNKPLVFDDIDE